MTKPSVSIVVFVADFLRIIAKMIMSVSRRTLGATVMMDGSEHHTPWIPVQVSKQHGGVVSLAFPWVAHRRRTGFVTDSIQILIYRITLARKNVT